MADASARTAGDVGAGAAGDASARTARDASARADDARGRRTGPYATAPRTVAIAARTAHIMVTGIYLGGRVLDVPEQRLRTWKRLTTLTGSVLLVTEVTHSRNWAHQGRGLTTMAHVGVLAAGHLDSRLAKGAAVSALLIGSVGSHLPRTVRKWSVLTRSVLP